MSKLTRSALKTLVKECLVEILSEGIGGSKSSANKKRAAKQRYEAEERRLQEHRKKFETKVDNTINHITDDPIMQSIFADTAKTTLQEQTEGPRASGVSQEIPASPSAGGIQLNDIFDSASQNWAHLAFVEKKTN